MRIPLSPRPAWRLMNFEAIFRDTPIHPATKVAGYEKQSPPARAGSGKTGVCAQTPYVVPTPARA